MVMSRSSYFTRKDPKLSFYAKETGETELTLQKAKRDFIAFCTLHTDRDDLDVNERESEEKQKQKK